MMRLRRAGSWSQIAATGGPSDRFGHASCFDSQGHRLIVMGGQKAADGFTGFHWCCTPWTLRPARKPRTGAINTSGTAPKPRARAHDHLRSGSGIGSSCSVARGRPFHEARPRSTLSLSADVWFLNLATYAWTKPTTTGTKPCPRSGHTAIFDPVTHRMRIYAGELGGGSGYTVDIYNLNLATLAWSRNVPPPSCCNNSSCAIVGDACGSSRPAPAVWYHVAICAIPGPQEW